MVVELTLLEKLRKSNDDYHTAVNEILGDKVPVATKASFAAMSHRVFEDMKRADEVIAEHYEPVEEIIKEEA